MASMCLAESDSPSQHRGTHICRRDTAHEKHRCAVCGYGWPLSRAVAERTAALPIGAVDAVEVSLRNFLSRWTEFTVHGTDLDSQLRGAAMIAVRETLAHISTANCEKRQG